MTTKVLQIFNEINVLEALLRSYQTQAQESRSFIKYYSILPDFKYIKKVTTIWTTLYMQSLIGMGLSKCIFTDSCCSCCCVMHVINMNCVANKFAQYNA